MDRKQGKGGKDVGQWWRNHIQQLTEIDSIKANDLATNANINPKAIYKGDLWTLKKLIIYKYYIDIYTRIIPNHYSNYYYFDLFSGSGLVDIGRKNKQCTLRVFGSALIGVLYSYKHKPFKKYIFVESNNTKYTALCSLFTYIKNSHKSSLDYYIINDDMNNINSYEKYLKECEHALVVIDPEGLEPKWATVEKILSYKCDVIITFMSKGIQRVLGRAKNSVVDRTTLKEFCGLPIDNIRDINEFEKQYIQQIKQKGKKEAYRTIDVSAKSFEYDIIIATKVTKKRNPWLRAIDDLKKRLDISDLELTAIIDQLQGKQSSLDNYRWIF